MCVQYSYIVLLFIFLKNYFLVSNIFKSAITHKASRFFLRISYVLKLHSTEKQV